MRTDQEILKLNYILTKLESGLDKAKETMVLSSFCFDIRLQNLEPVFQYRSVNSANESTYYYDLYYPAIKVIIEVDEEHHEKSNSKIEDEEKERHAKEELKCGFHRIRFHESRENVLEQIEAAKLEILKREIKTGLNNTIWTMKQFNVEEAIKDHSRTLVVSISRDKKFQDVRDIPLQIPKEIHDLHDISIVYLTGKTGTVGKAFIAQPPNWTLRQGNSYQNGIPNPDHPLLLSGHTFYRKNENLLWSPDLNNYFTNRTKYRDRKQFKKIIRK